MSQNRPDNDTPTTGGGSTSAGASGDPSQWNTSANASGDPTQWGSRSGGAGTGTATGLSTTGGGGEGGEGGVAAQAKQYGQKVAEYGQQAKDYLSERVSGVSDRIQDLRNKDYGQMADEAKDYARQNPGQALVVAAAAGFVLGLLLRGGRR